MKNFKKYLLLMVAMIAISQLFFVAQASAQFTILPYTNLDDAGCVETLQQNEVGQLNNCTTNENGTQTCISINMSEILACGIKTGRITLAMIPYFITYFANFLLSLSGIICVLFIVIGGYFYIYGGMTEQKDKGKKFIINALKGMIYSILAWVIVSIVINAVTS